MAGQSNLLFLMADDHAAEALSVAGHPLATTPNLDRLAAGGVRFTQHFCNSPLCTPSRQSLLTGQLPHRAGVTLLKTRLAEGKPTIAQQLQRAGYRTAVFGKMHFQTQARAGLHGFDICQSDHNWFEPELHPASPAAGVATTPPWWPFKDPAEIWLNAEKRPYPAFAADIPNVNTAEAALGFLRQQAAGSDRPFAAWVSFNPPHSPFLFPIELRDWLNADRVQLPAVNAQDADQIPAIFRHLTDAQRRGIVAAYLTSVYFMDSLVGRVLDGLENLGLADNTLVVYTSDHGFCLGQHGRFEKHCCYDQAIRVPLILRWPKRVRPGTVTTLTEGVDVAPTLLDLLEAPRLAIEDGQSLRAVLPGLGAAAGRADSDAVGARCVFSEYLENEEACVRTARYKLVYSSGRRRRTDHFESPRDQGGRWLRLYDLQQDPQEVCNVSAAFPAVVAELQTAMLERFRQTHPENDQEPAGLPMAEALDWYLRPRDD